MPKLGVNINNEIDLTEAQTLNKAKKRVIEKMKKNVSETSAVQADKDTDLNFVRVNKILEEQINILDNMDTLINSQGSIVGRPKLPYSSLGLAGPSGPSGPSAPTGPSAPIGPSAPLGPSRPTVFEYVPISAGPSRRRGRIPKPRTLENQLEYSNLDLDPLALKGPLELSKPLSQKELLVLDKYNDNYKLSPSQFRVLYNRAMDDYINKSPYLNRVERQIYENNIRELIKKYEGYIQNKNKPLLLLEDTKQEDKPLLPVPPEEEILKLPKKPKKPRGKPPTDPVKLKEYMRKMDEALKYEAQMKEKPLKEDEPSSSNQLLEVDNKKSFDSYLKEMDIIIANPELDDTHKLYYIEEVLNKVLDRYPDRKDEIYRYTLNRDLGNIVEYSYNPEDPLDTMYGLEKDDDMVDNENMYDDETLGSGRFKKYRLRYNGGAIAPRFYKEGSYIEYLTYLNKLISNQKTINNILIKSLPSIKYVSFDLINEFKELLNTYREKSEYIYSEAHDIKGNISINKTNMKNIDFDLIKTRWNEFIKLLSEHYNYYTNALNNYNEERQQKQQLKPSLINKYGLGYHIGEYMPSRYL